MFGRMQSKKPHREVVPNFYYFGEGPMLDCNIYALRKKNGKITLFDLGNGLSFSALSKSFTDLGWKIEDVEDVFITHDHLDHLMGLYKLMENFSENPPIIYGHPYTIDMIKRGDEKEIVPRLFNVSPSTFDITIKPLSNVQKISESESISFDNFTFDVFFTPGHSQGSICLYEPDKKLLIAGDVVFPNGSFGRYDFPGCSLSDLKNSIAKLEKLDVNYLCAGHMAPVQNEANRHLKQSLKNIQMM